MRGCGWNFAALTDCFHFTSLNIYINIFWGFSPVINFSSPLARGYCSLLLIYFSSGWNELCGSLLEPVTANSFLSGLQGCCCPNICLIQLPPAGLSCHSRLRSSGSVHQPGHPFRIYTCSWRGSSPHMSTFAMFTCSFWSNMAMCICCTEANLLTLWIVGNSLQVIRFQVCLSCPFKSLNVKKKGLLVVDRSLLKWYEEGL